MCMVDIKYLGMEDLNEEEQNLTKQLSEEYFERIQRDLKNELCLIAHIKVMNTGGERKEFSISVRTEAPLQIIEASEEDWNLEVGLHKAYKKLEKEIQHKFHTDRQHD